MEVLRLWCDERQLKKVKTLRSCRMVKRATVRTLRGLERVCIVFGEEGLQYDIDKALE